MHDEGAFLKAIQADPGDDALRLVYADWLDEQGDPRGAFVRLHRDLRLLPPDHPHRAGGEDELSRLRRGIDRGWLASVEPERAHHYENPPRRPSCACFEAGYKNRRWPRMRFHVELQDTACDAWKRLLDLVEEAAADGRTEFAPERELGRDAWSQIVTLPPTIAKLKAVRHLQLYGSHLIRLPPEVGEMTSLQLFDPYTSYRLHWFPYEITRCRHLLDSRVSTRALYGNHKFRPPFPLLSPYAAPSEGPPTRWQAPAVRQCSVCDRPYEDLGIHRAWISLRVATDVLPLLVNACSEECLRRLSKPADGYVRQPHRGGPGVQQPRDGG
jgi:uncharacterized protein (TIGR02996 family)